MVVASKRVRMYSNASTSLTYLLQFRAFVYTYCSTSLARTDSWPGPRPFPLSPPGRPRAVVSDVWQLERVDIEPPRMCRMELRVVVCIMVLEAVSIKRIVTVNNLEKCCLGPFYLLRHPLLLLNFIFNSLRLPCHWLANQ